MFRTLLRVVLLLIILAAVAAFVVGYRMAPRDRAAEPEHATGTTGTVDVGRARRAGAAIGETVAAGANQAQRVASNAALTAKIKSKMALDDTIDAAAINVDTADGRVTLRGFVDTAAQRERALELARETEGVTSVVNRLTIR